jgi:hypothetical protein
LDQTHCPVHPDELLMDPDDPKVQSYLTQVAGRKRESREQTQSLSWIISLGVLGLLIGCLVAYVIALVVFSPTGSESVMSQVLGYQGHRSWLWFVALVAVPLGCGTGGAILGKRVASSALGHRMLVYWAVGMLLVLALVAIVFWVGRNSEDKLSQVSELAIQAPKRLGSGEPDRASCENGEMKACYRLARAYSDESWPAFEMCKNRPGGRDCPEWENIKTKMELSTLLFLRACEGGQKEACASAGAAYENGWGIEPDLDKAAKYYDNACRAQVMGGCYALGALSASDWKGRDPGQSLKLFRMTCEGKHALACRKLAQMTGEGDGTPKDEAMAKKYFARACELGDDLSCQLAR